MNFSPLPLLLLVVVLALNPFKGLAQEIIGTAGRSDTVANVIVDFTIGEIMTQTFSNSTNILTQGIHQPVFQIVAIDEELSIIPSFTIYPNPTPDRLHFSFAEGESIEFRVLLLSLQGQLLASHSFQGKGSLSLATWSEGVYLIQVDIPSLQHLLSYKIIKSH
ncbi:MAG: T9SS type A sorting domain-containing protein [Bacteroidota bacterium]